MKSSKPETAQVKPKGAVYFSKFTLQDYLRTKTLTNLHPAAPGPTQKDFINAASRLRPTAQPFLPSNQLNPRAVEFFPRGAESCVEVMSLDYDDGKSFIQTSCPSLNTNFTVKAKIPVDPVSPMISLVELEKYFPLAKGGQDIGPNNTARYLVTINIPQDCFSSQMRKAERRG